MYKDRQVYSTLEKQKHNRKITILVGTRQVGKTTVLTRLYERHGVKSALDPPYQNISFTETHHKSTKSS